MREGFKKMTAECVQQYKVGVLQNILREGGLKWARGIWGSQDEE